MNSITRLSFPYLIIVVFSLGAFSYYTAVYSNVNFEFDNYDAAPSGGATASSGTVVRDTEISSIVDTTLLMSAPPRSSKDWDTFPPIVEWMSQKLGVTIKYEQASEWDVFDHDLVKEKYDIVFGGPHYVQYLHKKFNYDVVAKLPNPQQWTIITRVDSNIKHITQLSGKTVCVEGVRSFARLLLFNEFEHQPARLPIPTEVDNRETGFNNVIEGKCLATIISTAEYNAYVNNYKIDTTPDDGSIVDVPVTRIHTFKANPNQAFVISSSVSEKYKNEIVELLLSNEGQEKMQMLRDRWGGGKQLISAQIDEYNKVKKLLLSSPIFGSMF